MNTVDKVAVCSRSFSKNLHLREELLKRYSKVTFNDFGEQLHGTKLIEFLRDHDKAIIALEKIDDSILKCLPRLKVISKYGVGLDMIDLQAMRANKVQLGWIGGVNKRSVSELAIAFSISMLRFTHQANAEVLSGIWRQTIGSQLTEKKFGIVGCGNVGKDLVRLLKPFNCQIYVNDIAVYEDFYKEHGVICVSLEELLSESDVISLHVPLNSDTENLLSAARLSLIKPTSILINLARGGLVDELALKNMLKERKLLGAAFDVFHQEPPQDFELLNLPNFFSTPHIGGSSAEAILAMGLAAIKGLDENAIPC